MEKQIENYQDSNLFDNVLEKNEKVIKIIKPNKLKLFVYWLGYAFWINVWIALIGIIPMIGTSLETNTNFPWQYYMIVVGVIVIIFVVTAILAQIYYKNNYFAYTNARILIRSGIIGIDYKSLDMRYVGALNVRVGFWDKVLKQETGTITFGSMSSPMATSKAVGYNFAHIEKPYELYKEMKQVVEEVKEKYKNVI